MTNEEKALLSKIGKKGGKTTKKRYGADYYRKLADKRWSVHKSKVQALAIKS